VFAELDVTNIFNQHELENAAFIDTSLTTNVRDRNLAAFNPLTSTPVECPRTVATSSAQCRNIANFRYSPTFGRALNTGAYQQPRSYNIAFGARF
jgi:hypothetical protein